MLAGEIVGHESGANDGNGVNGGKNGDAGSAYAIRSGHRMLVEIAGWYVRNSIALATIVSALGDRLSDMLSPQEARALSSLRHGGLAAGWLEEIREALARPPLSPTINQTDRKKLRDTVGREDAIEPSHQ